MTDALDALEAAARKGLMVPNDEVIRLIARCRALEAVAVAYELWEADLIMNDDCWRDPSGMPIITPELWDRHGEIQSMRNDALGRFK
jgi:hypothetical protein